MYRIEETEHETILVNDLGADYGMYSYADYLKWRIEERLELIKGKIFKMSAPQRLHQKISRNIFVPIANFLLKKSCEVYSAPFDVRLPVQNKKKDNEVTTVVQPDICVICDPAKLDAKGCCGAPDLVVEILSPGNSRMEVQNKFELYEESGVLEYWIVFPGEKNIVIYTLVNGKYVGSKPFAPGENITSAVLPGFDISVENIFEN